jgi:hypothetical protein
VTVSSCISFTFSCPLISRSPKHHLSIGACESASQVGEENSNFSHKVLDGDCNSSQAFSFLPVDAVERPFAATSWGIK